MELRLFQKGFNYSQDGDGNRLVYHLQGCNMKCAWCANPEGMPPEGAVIADEDWLEEGICPYGAVRERKLDRTYCNTCLEKDCIRKNRSKGIRCSFDTYPIEELEEEILSASPMFFGGGGVTFTGGEPTLQFGSLLELMTRVNADGIHTALETNGSHPKLERLFPYTDLLIMDCKQCDGEKHRKYTGMEMSMVQENIKKAAAREQRVHLRVPLIGGVNDSEEDIQKFLDFFRTIKGPDVTFELLPYHEFGKKKWEQCGFRYRMDQNSYVSESAMQEFRARIESLGCRYHST